MPEFFSFSVMTEQSDLQFHFDGNILGAFKLQYDHCDHCLQMSFLQIPLGGSGVQERGAGCDSVDARGRL